jgi:hypothetical protein
MPVSFWLVQVRVLLTVRNICTAVETGKCQVPFQEALSLVDTEVEIEQSPKTALWLNRRSDIRLDLQWLYRQDKGSSAAFLYLAIEYASLRGLMRSQADQRFSDISFIYVSIDAQTIR